jgi:DNA-binding winged helix-turn-helix (wHTH) protein
MRTTKTKTYRVCVELDVILKESSLVVHTPEGIASAVRHALRTNLPTSTFMQAGYRFDANTVHAELKQQEEDANV